ncbi:MAG: P-II family nitrogen regulator [Clostridiales bacterium]|nr:P-II family nitrogen regulator [Clostridiales bacterium]
MLKLIEQMKKEENRDSDDSAKRSEMKMEESTYALIMAIVDRGYSEAVMEAARPKGATGGTVINSRRVGTEEAMRFWGISVQPERELVLILADRSEKKNIMKAIAESCGMRQEAHGVVMSLPVDSVVGLD